MSFTQPAPELTECDREPIHTIASIQPFGGLIQLSADWRVTNRSLNCAAMLSLSDLPETGASASSILSPNAIELIQKSVANLAGPDAVARLFGLRLTPGGELFDCAVHCVGGSIVIEFEPHDPSDYADHLALIGPVLSQLEPLRDVEKLCERAAELVRDMLGYDRVMVYKFHADESGEVIAEDKRDDLEPFLGLRYPQADIPQQARDLFRRNRFRVIADMREPSVPIEPATAFGGAPLDLSMSMLRSHSDMHVQYMTNMGVQASLTIAIVRHGRLWGMFSCHHGSSRLPPYSLRTVAELFSQMFSLILDRILVDASEKLRMRGRALHDQLMVRLAGGNTLADSLSLLDDLLDNVIQHDGVSVLIDGQYSARGQAPSEEQFAALPTAFGSAPMSAVLSTAHLAHDVPAAAAFSDIAAGALIIPVSRSPRDYLVLWRKPLAQTVTWAGDPRKAAASPGKRLEPRESFSAWIETVEGRSKEWSHDEMTIAESVRVTLLEVVLRITDEVAQERAKAQQQQQLLIAELNHRVRNILNLIRSLVSQSENEAIDVSSFASIIGGRIAALASAHDNTTRDNWAPASLSELLATELAAYINEKKHRFELIGSDVLIKPEAYTVLALVVHELVTNSAKYGSLCDSTGTLTVTLSRSRSGDLEIEWRESGGPPVIPPKRRGFGSTIIERSIPFELKGDADLRYEPDGVEANFTIPKRYINDPEADAYGTPRHKAPRPSPPAEPSSDAELPPSALPEHVLVVEDSMIIALDVEETLKRLGVRSVAVAGSVAGALSAIAKRRPDFAIIDFNLGGETSEPVAERLRESEVRFVLATGYAEMADQVAAMGASALLRKPYGKGDLEDAVTNRSGSGPPAGAQDDRVNSVN